MAVMISPERRLALSAALPGARLRPHVKTHKCIELARRQAEHGHLGFCCATVRETIGNVVRDYSSTGEEIDEVRIANLDGRGDEFDHSLAELYALEEESRKGYDTLSRAAGLGRGAFG